MEKRSKEMMKTIIEIKINILAKPHQTVFNSIAYWIFDLGIWIMKLKKDNLVYWKIDKKFSPLKG